MPPANSSSNVKPEDLKNLQEAIRKWDLNNALREAILLPLNRDFLPMNPYKQVISSFRAQEQAAWLAR
jgi:hypothetical protein